MSSSAPIGAWASFCWVWAPLCIEGISFFWKVSSFLLLWSSAPVGWASVVKMHEVHFVHWAPLVKVNGVHFVHWASLVKRNEIHFVHWAPLVKVNGVHFVHWAPRVKVNEVHFVHWAPLVKVNEVCFVHWAPLVKVNEVCSLSSSGEGAWSLFCSLSSSGEGEWGPFTELHWWRLMRSVLFTELLCELDSFFSFCHWGLGELEWLVISFLLTVNSFVWMVNRGELCVKGN